MDGEIFVAVRKIAFGDGVGGMERAASEHICALIRQGVKVRLFAPKLKIEGNPPPELTIIDVPWPKWDKYKRLSTFGLAYNVWVRRLAVSLADSARTGDVIHLHGAAAGASSWLRKRDRNFAIVVNPHGMEEFGKRSWPREANRVFLRALARGARQADITISTDEILVNQVLSNLGVDSNKVRVIPNSVDVEKLRSEATFAAMSSTFTIVSVGRVVHNKGYDLLLAAIKEDSVQRRMPSGFRWVHYGSGPGANTIIRQAREHPVVDLTVRSNQSDAIVQSAMSAANIFVQPSRYEGSSLTTLEAMAHGCVVVGTPVGGIPDKITDGVNGFLAREVSAVGLAHAIVRAAEASAQEIGREAMNTVEQRFSVDTTIRTYIQLYEELAI